MEKAMRVQVDPASHLGSRLASPRLAFPRSMKFRGHVNLDVDRVICGGSTEEQESCH